MMKSGLWTLTLLLVLGCKAHPGQKPELQQEPAAAPSTAKMIQEGEQRSRIPAEQYSGNRYLHIKVEAGELDGMKGAELWYTTDDGKNWINHGLTEGRPDVLKFLAPADGRYAFVKVPVDKDGNRGFTPKSTTAPHMIVVVDTTPAVVEMRSPNGGELFPAGSMTLITWVAEDANLAPNPITIEVSSDDGQHWIALATDEINDGSYYWDIPRTSSTSYKVRVTAADRAGNKGSDESDAKFTVDGLPPDARIVGPTVSTSPVTEIKYVAHDVGGGEMSQIKLYISRNDGATWEYYGNDDDLKSPFEFKALDGVFGLKLVGIDRLGNSMEMPAPGTPPQVALYVDSTPPLVDWITFNDKGVYAGGHPYEIMWAAKDNMKMVDNSISLYVSSDNGLTWNAIAKDVENTGATKWMPPMVAGNQYRLKIVAVDVLRNASEKITQPFTVDTEIPEAIATGPVKSSSNSVKIDYVVKNLGSSPLAEVTLWITPDGGKSWHKYGQDPDMKPPFEFVKNDGVYGITITAATALGLKTNRVQKPPTDGTVPQLFMAIDATPPQATLMNFSKGGFYRGGERRDILWDFKEENVDAEGMTILYSDDGGAKWTEVAPRLDMQSKKYGWILPTKPTRAGMLRLVAKDSFGNTSPPADSERVFTVDSDTPRLKLLKSPGVSKYKKFKLGYEASDDTSGIDHVEFWGRTVAGGPYRKLGSQNVAVGEIELTVDDEGAWELVGVAVDGAGLSSREPQATVPPDAKVVIDSVSPMVEISRTKGPDNRDLYANNKLEISWKATDNLTNSGEILIRVEFSIDGGSTWRVLKEGMKNTGGYSVKETMTAGKKYRFRVTAIDQAGNEKSDETADFGIEDVAPQGSTDKPPVSSSKLIVTASRQPSPSGKEFTISFSGPEGIKGLTAEVTLPTGVTVDWPVRMEGKTLVITAPTGRGKYLLKVMAKDPVTGTEIVSNAIEFTVEVAVSEEKEYALELNNFKGGDEPIAGGYSRPVMVRVKNIPLREVQVELSEQSGADGSWKKQTGLQVLGPSGMLWQVPKVTATTCRLRVSWKAPDGRMIIDQSKADFTIDSTPPVVMPTGPQQAETAPLEIKYEGRTSVVPISMVTLYYTTDQGKTWTSDTRVEFKRPLYFNPPSKGDYGIYLTGRLVGADKDSEPPMPGTSPKMMLKYTGPDRIALDIKATRLVKRLLAGGEEVVIEWQSALDLPKSVRIELVANGKKIEDIATDLSSSGKYVWKTRNIDKDQCEIRVFIRRGAEENMAIAGDFDIDSTAPDWDFVTPKQ